MIRMAWWGPWGWWGWPPWRGWRCPWGPWGYYWWSYYAQPQVELSYLQAYEALLNAQLSAVRSRIAALKGSSAPGV